MPKQYFIYNIENKVSLTNVRYVAYENLPSTRHCELYLFFGHMVCGDIARHVNDYLLDYSAQ